MNQLMSHAPSPAAPEATLERWLTGPRFAPIPARSAMTPVPALSFEFFPPKNDALETQLWTCIRRLEPLAPRFVSVTYGAGGTTQARTHATVTRLVRESSLVPAAHLTCVGASREVVDAVAREYWEGGVRHIVALRGDAPPGEDYVPHPDGYASAADLFEVGFNHFFHAGTKSRRGDLVFFQPHSAPGVYARAFLEGRLSEDDLLHYRQELTAPAFTEGKGAGGLSS